jgi:hypothetical protein
MKSSPPSSADDQRAFGAGSGGGIKGIPLRYVLMGGVFQIVACCVIYTKYGALYATLFVLGCLVSWGVGAMLRRGQEA